MFRRPPLILFVLSIIGCSSTERLKISCYNHSAAVKAKIINPESFYPESPLWQMDRLYYVEYSRNRIMEWNGSNAVAWEEAGCGPSGITSTADGLWVTCYDSNSIVRLKLGKSTEVSQRLSTFKGANDIVKDAHGGLYFTASGVFDLKSPVEGKVYYLDRENKTHLVLDKIHYANGIALINEGKNLIVAEHLQNRLLQFSVSSPGKVDPLSRKVAVSLSSFPINGKDLSNGLLGPDGIRLGADGFLYVAQYGGSRVLRFQISKTGSLDLIGQIKLTSSFPNTDNVWVTDDGKIFGSAVEETTDPNYPGIIYMIEAKDLPPQSTVECKVY